MTRPVVMTVSQATGGSGSLARSASRMGSEIWSATLSGWPSVTDSDVNRLVAMNGSSFESPAPARPGLRVGPSPSARFIPLGRRKYNPSPMGEGSGEGREWHVPAPHDGFLRFAPLHVVDARMAHEPRAPLGPHPPGRGARRLDHTVDELPFHLP